MAHFHYKTTHNVGGISRLNKQVKQEQNKTKILKKNCMRKRKQYRLRFDWKSLENCLYIFILYRRTLYFHTNALSSVNTVLLNDCDHNSVEIKNVFISSSSYYYYSFYLLKYKQKRYTQLMAPPLIYSYF